LSGFPTRRRCGHQAGQSATGILIIPIQRNGALVLRSRIVSVPQRFERRAAIKVNISILALAKGGV
jgi:hypothetical protein